MLNFTSSASQSKPTDKTALSSSNNDSQCRKLLRPQEFDAALTTAGWLRLRDIKRATRGQVLSERIPSLITGIPNDRLFENGSRMRSNISRSLSVTGDAIVPEDKTTVHSKQAPSVQPCQPHTWTLGCQNQIRPTKNTLNPCRNQAGVSRRREGRWQVEIS